jgi:8-oxo-dGTP diphosphatase
LKTVVAAILEHEGKILIARRGPDDRLAGNWEFPGGTQEADETPEACLRREMREEFAIDIAVGAFLGASVYHYDHGAIRLLAYRANWIEGQLQCLVHDAYAWVAVTDLQHYTFSPADVPFVRGLLQGEIIVT